jgi:ATP-dependent helicase/nuclease subunit A
MALAPLSREKETILALEASLVVAAGAGSGKTTLLARAVASDLLSDRFAVEDVLVVAFNNAAAAHLVARIQAELQAGSPPDRPAWDLSCAWIGTFHGLCGRIVREHPHAAGVAPDFVVLDEVEARVLVEAAVDEAIEATDDAGLDMLATVTEREARKACGALLAQLRAAGQEPPAIPPVTAPPAPDLTALRECTAAVVASTARDAVKELAGDLLAALEAGDLPTGSLPGNVANAAKDCCAAWNAEWCVVRAALRDRAALPHLDAFRRFFADTVSAYERLKQERGALDYEDLQLRARRVLRGRPAEHRFARVYVDEAQDVNPLQAELVEMLSGGRTWQVGDERQAIYRFRHADPDCFRRTAAAVGARPLAENWRSQPAVLAALNGWLGAGLTSKVAPAPTPAAPVELALLRDAPGAPAMASEPLEVARIARRLHDEEGFGWGEIAILFRGRTHMPEHDDALRAAGVPTVVLGVTSFVEHEQVRDVLCLLRLVENPLDEEALLRVLTSPYVGASDDDLVGLRAAAGEDAPLWPAIRAGAVLHATALLEELDGLRERRARVDLPGLVEAAIAARDYELAALGLGDGGRRYANLRKLVAMADSYGRVRGADLRGFLDFLDRTAQLDADPGEAVVVDEHLDAVRLLTIHAAKGQEFPAVIVADCSNRGGGGSAAVVVAGDRVGLRLRFDGGGLDYCFAFDAIGKDESAAGAEEEKRVYYVGLTRAMRSLTVAGRVKDTRNGPTYEGGLGFLVPALLNGAAPPDSGAETVITTGAGSVRVRSVAAEVPEASGRVPPPPAVEGEAPPEPPRPAPVDPVVGRRISYSALAAHATCSLRHHLEWELGLPASTVPVAGLPVGTGARAFGERFHEEISRVAWAEPVLAWDDERAQRLFSVVRDGPLGRRLAAAEEVRLERPFLLALDGVVVEGVLDMWAREADGSVLVVDWKTGAGGDSYALQRAVYALAVLRSGAPAVETAWCFLESGEVVGGRFSAEDVAALESEVGAAVAALRDEPRPVVEVAAAVCVGCPGLQGWCVAAPGL